MNEIGHDYDSGETLYATRFQLNGDVFITDGSADELWGASGHDADDYDVTMPEKGSSGHYVGDFDTSGNIAVGVYRVTVYLQAGANPADSDKAIAKGVMYWNGSEEINILTLNTLETEIIPAGYVGDYKAEEIVYFLWRTKATPSVDGTIKVYKNDGTGEVTAPTGITDDRDFDGLTGVHLCRIDLSANSFYAVERDYSVVLNGATINGQSVTTPIGSFSIENRFQGVDWKRDV